MSDLQILVDMGFSHNRAAKALEVTNNKGFEPAMEWLLAHVDELDAAQSVPTADGSAATPVEAAAEGHQPSTTADTATSDEAGEEAKSFKCDDCNRLFKSQMEIEFHAAKSGHSSFSESTEEKKPLTEEEKKEQLNKLEEKLRQKRLERENREKQEALEKERIRIKSGKDLTEAHRRMEEMEMKKLVEQRKREKQEEKQARDRVRAQIEADKAARRERMAADAGQVPPAAPVVSSTAPVVAATPKIPASYTSTRIQIRLEDGKALTETFDVKEQLAAVRLFTQLKRNSDTPFSLMTSFPRKVFTVEDYDKPLEVLGLVPSAVLIVTKATA